MCELFAMSADRPTDVGHYLSRLMPRGGDTGPHADGWGVAYYEDRAARVFKDPAPAADSRLLAMLAAEQVKSKAVIAHIRKANPSMFGRATANTHPFEREWKGRSWVFAHNGKLPGLGGRIVCSDSQFRPLGDTDSELAFCYILDAIAREIDVDLDASPARLVEAITPVVEELAGFGEFNFILGDGECLYVYAHTNLHLLQRTVYMGGETRRMSLLATAPLTGEPWERLAPSRIRVFREGGELLPQPNATSSVFREAA